MLKGLLLSDYNLWVKDCGDRSQMRIAVRRRSASGGGGCRVRRWDQVSTWEGMGTTGELCRGFERNVVTERGQQSLPCREVKEKVRTEDYVISDLWE